MLLPRRGRSILLLRLAAVLAPALLLTLVYALWLLLARGTAPRAAQATPSPLATSVLYLARVSRQEARPTAIAPTSTVPPGLVLEPFEATPQSWRVSQDGAGGGALIERSSSQAASGSYSARVTTSASGARALIMASFADAADNHSWEERPGTWHWQQAAVYLPSATVAQLGAGEFFTLAGMWPSSGGPFGWYLRVGQGGQLEVQGYTADGTAAQFSAYGAFPQDRWVELELGLHSQKGPGVQRSFAFLIDGSFYGWYRQGNMKSEIYDRAAVGILSTNSADSLSLFIDQWRVARSERFPGGPDRRSSARVQEQDFRTRSGVQVQHDWSTWQYSPVLHAQYGLYPSTHRLQSGRNIDRMPDLSDGWAEIEIDWPQGAPPDSSPSGYFGPMVGFHKEINREENLELIPIGRGGGQVDLALEAWVGDGPEILATWPLPAATLGAGSHIPEPGDIIRARWRQASPTLLNVRASFYDASAARWHTDIISGSFNVADIHGINYLDGYHSASSITIDSPYYSIRRYKVGTLDTAP